jgi:hypothetical protein
MSGVPKIEIVESAETLKSLMKQQKAALNHERRSVNLHLSAFICGSYYYLSYKSIEII